jgi:gliding motility-associated-like protein
MKTSIKVLILMLGFVTNTLQAQEFFICDENGDLGKVNLQDCSYKRIPQKRNGWFIGDITFNPNGKMYGVANATFFQLDTLPNSVSIPITNISIPGSTSLTADQNGIIYGAGSQYWSYNPSTKVFKNYGYMVAEGDTIKAAGDLTYYNGDLYVVSTKNKLVKLNLQNPTLCTTIMAFSNQNIVLGIVSFKDCEGSKTYAITAGDSSKILEIDWENKTTKHVCTIPVEALGAASRFEYLASKPDITYIEQYTCDKTREGITTQKLRNVQNCDSTITIKTLYIGSSPTFTSFYTCDKREIKTDTIRFKNIRGCDSLIISTGILKNDTLTINQTICQGDSIYFNNRYLKDAGNYYQSFTRAPLCDSIIHLNLSLKARSIQTIESWTCESSKVKYDTLKKNINAICDTIFLHHNRLALRTYDSTYIDKILCFGEKYYWDSRFLSSNDTYKAIFKNEYGCDSLVTLNLKILDKDSIFQEKQTCNPKKLGLKKDVLINHRGCDSVVLTNFTLREEIRFNQSLRLCEGTSLRVGDTIYKTSGTYVRRLKNTEGCDSIVSTDLTIVHLDLKMPNDTFLNLGDSIYLLGNSRADFPIKWKWTPQSAVSCDSCNGTWTMPIFPTMYSLTISDSVSKCRKEGRVYIRTGRECSVFVPNIFSPNGDGKNDNLKIYYGNCVKRIERYAIYNRWGNLIKQHSFNTQESIAKEVDIWDGLINGKIADADLYVYYVVVEYINGFQEVVKGDVMVLGD